MQITTRYYSSSFISINLFQIFIWFTKCSKI